MRLWWKRNEKGSCYHGDWPKFKFNWLLSDSSLTQIGFWCLSKKYPQNDRTKSDSNRLSTGISFTWVVVFWKDKSLEKNMCIIIIIQHISLSLSLHPSISNSLSLSFPLSKCKLNSSYMFYLSQKLSLSFFIPAYPMHFSFFLILFFPITFPSFYLHVISFFLSLYFNKMFPWKFLSLTIMWAPGVPLTFRLSMGSQNCLFSFPNGPI